MGLQPQICIRSFQNPQAKQAVITRVSTVELTNTGMQPPVDLQVDNVSVSSRVVNLPNISGRIRRKILHPASYEKNASSQLLFSMTVVGWLVAISSVDGLAVFLVAIRAVCQLWLRCASLSLCIFTRVSDPLLRNL